MAAPIVTIGAFDSKGAEYAFLREQILEQGADVLTVDVGVLGDNAPFPVDVSAAEVASAGGGDLARAVRNPGNPSPAPLRRHPQVSSSGPARSCGRCR